MKHNAPSTHARHPLRVSLLSLCLGAAFAAQAQAPARAASTSLETVTVTGQTASLRKALAVQEGAHHVVSVISADDIGALPDKNAAEALARLPGVSLQRDQGEGRYVVVRGLGPDLNSVTINGSLVPAPEGSRRGVALDTLPAGMVRSLEVSKSLTPDRDANSIGGTIEVKTLTAFDLPGSLLSATAGVSHDQNTGKKSPSGSLLWASRFLDGKLGLAVGVGAEKRKFGSDNVETGGAWTAGRLSGFELRDYLPVRERKAVSASVDFRPSAGQSYYLRGFLSQFSDDEVRDRLTIGNVASSATTPGGTFAEGQTVTARAERRMRQRKYTQEIQSLTVGTEQQWADWTVQGAIGLGRASEDTPESINDSRFRQNNVAGVSFTDSRKPQLSGPAALYNTDGYSLNSITLQQRDSQDDERNARFDAERKFKLDGRDATLKFGAKRSSREKTNDTNQWAYNSSNATSASYWGAGPTTLTAFAKGELDYPLGRIGAGIDPAVVRARVATLPRDPARLVRESAVGDFRLNEDIDAAYLQGGFDLNERFNLLAGLRVERTSFDARGNQISTSNAVQSIERSRRDSHWLPGLHGRYEIDAKTSVRAAIWHSVVRANFSQLAPSVNLVSATEATIGNPDLRPLRSRNFDVSVERLLGMDGVLSAYAFNKDIRDFTYTTNLAGTGAWSGYTTATSYANGDAASVVGMELAYSQPLRMLPGALSGLIVGVNATFSDARATLSRFDKAANTVLSREIKLPGQSSVVYNLMLGYEHGPISTRLALNQKSRYLLEVGGDILSAAQDRYVDRQRQLDFSLAYQFDKRLQFVVEAININNEKYYVYQGSQPYNTQYEQYGRTLKLSVKAALF
jgi:TonB-dependent receptor